MALVQIEPGSAVNSSPVNSNFNYLNDLIAALTTTESGHYSTLSGNITNLISQVGGLQSPEIIDLGTATNPLLTNRSIHKITISGNTTFRLPSIGSSSVFSQMLVLVSMPTAYPIQLSNDLPNLKYFYNTQPDVSKAGFYTVLYEHSGTNWVAGAMFKGA